MKKFWLVGLIIAAMVVPELSRAQVQVASGTMQISGKVKWVYAYKAESEDAVGAGDTIGVGMPGQIWGMDGQGIEQFLTTNVEIDINGTLGDKVAYVIELQAAGGNNMQSMEDVVGANLGWMSGPKEMGPIGVRQAKMMFKDVIPMTTVTIGTFNLPVTIYQQRATNDYDLIMLPLLNILPARTTLPGGAGNATYSPMGLGWQATGVNFAIQPADMIELDVSYFNGNNGGMPNVDTDLEKSWLINLKVMPVEGAMISIAYLTEGWQGDRLPDAGLGTIQHNSSGYLVSGAYDNKKLEVNFDWTTNTVKDYQFYKNKLQNLTSTGYQITAGYWVTDAIEPVVRYEFFDPNTANTKKTWAPLATIPTYYPSNYDALTVLTLGVNYRVTENSEVSANYLWITEQGDDIDIKHTSGGLPDPQVGNKYQALANDMFLIQVQLWQ